MLQKFKIGKTSKIDFLLTRQISGQGCGTVPTDSVPAFIIKMQSGTVKAILELLKIGKVGTHLRVSKEFGVVLISHNQKCPRSQNKVLIQGVLNSLHPSGLPEWIED